MNKVTALTLVAVGVGLAVYGISCSDSVSSSLSRLLTGAPSNKTLWFLISGGSALAIGVTGFFRGSNVR
jgi:hypothetical protein